jgi:hypothetical protein
MTWTALVLAHKQPEQVARLLDRLAPASRLLHVGASADQQTFARFAEGAHRRDVPLVARQRSSWASWGIVAAVLEGMRLALQTSGWTHLVVLSGQDYPLHPSGAIETFLAAHPHASFIGHWSMPTRLWGPDGGMSRLRYRHRPVAGRRLFLPIPRRLPAGLSFWGGSLWSCLTRRAVEGVLEFVRTRPDVVRFYRSAWIPDEMFVPTALMNSVVRDEVVNESLHFVRWSTPGAPHPDVLRAADLPALAAAAAGPSEVGGYARRKLFARKVDPRVDAALLDRIDAELLTPRTPRPGAAPRP